MSRGRVEASNDPQVTDRQTRAESLLETINNSRGIILILLIGVGVGVWYFDVSIPQFTIGQIYAAFLTFLGLFGGRLIWSKIQPYIREERVYADIIPFNTEVSDQLKIPKQRWKDFKIIGGPVPTRSTFTGKQVYGLRAIDFERDEVFPADDFPDESEVPDFWDIIARGTTKDDNRYRDYLLDKAKKYSKLVVDDEVIREDARGDAVMMYAKGLQDGRNGEIDIERKPEAETILEAEQIIEQMEGQGKNEGDEQ